MSNPVRQVIITAKSSIKCKDLTVDGANLPARIKLLRVVIDNRLHFGAHVTAVCKACNYHTWAPTSQLSAKPVIITHGRCFTYVTVTLCCAVSIVVARRDYYNSV